MNTYTSSKKIVSKVINLALLLSTTHFVLINNAPAHFEESIDPTEKIADFDPNNLPQEDIEAIKAGTKKAMDGVQETIDDFLHLNEIKRARDEALLKFQREKGLREKSEEEASGLGKQLFATQSELTDKKNEISQLEIELTKRENILTSLQSEKQALFSELDRKNNELHDLKLEQDILNKELNETKAKCSETEEKLSNATENSEKFKADVASKLDVIRTKQAQIETQRDNLQKDVVKLKNDLTEKEQLLGEKEAQISQFKKSLAEAQQDYEVAQNDMAKLKNVHEEEKLTLSKNGRIKCTKLKNNLAEKEQLLGEKEEQISRFKESLAAGQKDYQMIQENIETLKANYAQEKLSLSDLHQTKIEEINKVILEKEQLLSEKEEQISRFKESLAAGQKDYEIEQNDMAKLKDEYEKEKLTLIENSRIKSAKLKNAITESKKLLDEKEAQIARLEQEQYNMLEQGRDFDDIRSYFAQQEKQKLEADLSEASARKIDQLSIQYQLEKSSLEEKVDNLNSQLVDVTQDFTKRLSEAEERYKNSEQELVKTKNELENIAIEKNNQETIIANLQKNLTDNQQELSSVLMDHSASADKIKELQNNNRSLETKLNELLTQRDQNSSKITELQEKLLSTQEERNNYIAQIATLKEQNHIIQENLAKKILLQEQSIHADNDQRELDIFSQSRELDINNATPIPTHELTSQTINEVKSMTSVMANSIESSVNQLYDNISSRFNWGDHVSSGEERGQMEMWVKQAVGTISQKPTDKIEEGYRGRTHALFVGIDHECGLGDKNLIGAAIALNNKSTTHLSKGGQLITDSNIISVYGKYHLNNQLALSGAVSYFRAATEANNFGEDINKIKTHGTRFDLELSYNKILGNQLLQPFIGASYSNISAFDMNLKNQGIVIKTKRSRLLSGKIGTRVQLKQYSLESGINISPSLVASISKPLKIISGNRFMMDGNVLNEDNNLLTHRIKDATLNLGGELRINRHNVDIIGSYNLGIRKKYQAHSGAIKVEVKL